MRGYPKHIATRQDFINLLGIAEFKDLALSDLKVVFTTQDDHMDRVVSYDKDEQGQMINVVTERIPAVNPKWKQKGFASRQAVADLIIEYGGEV